MFHRKKTRIVVFVYGGGMRGLVAAHIMNRIEEATGLHMADMVDIFTGPSTGAILNAALNTPATDYPAWHPSAQPRFRARHMIRFYEQEGLKIFPRDRFRAFRGFIHDFNNRTIKIGQLNALFKLGHYNPAHLGHALRRLYGETRLSETIRSLVIPVYSIDSSSMKDLAEDNPDLNPGLSVTSFLNEGGQALWLKHIVGSQNPKSHVDVKLYDAVLGSCAAPTYFPCHHFKFRYSESSRPVECSAIDGSIFDNPCITWHGAVRHHLDPAEKTIMILIGTGYTGRSYKKEDWNRFGGLGVVDPRNDLPLINMLFQAPESALMDSFVQDMGANLFVFNKSLVAEQGKPNTPSIPIDDASPENLKKMEHFAASIIEDNKQRFDELCHLLVANRDVDAARKSTLWKSMKKKIFKKRPSQVQ